MKYFINLILLSSVIFTMSSIVVLAGDSSKKSQATDLKNEKKLTYSPQKTIELKESLVEIQGKKFRKMELEKEAFFVEALDSTNADAEMRVLCQTSQEEIPMAQLTTGVKISKRSSIVIEGIRKVCKEAISGQKEVQMDPSILMGLQIETGKSKKWLISPFGVNFKANW